jgi:hypothetical protein
MPKYKTKKVRTAIKRRRTAIKAVPRDKRLLMRWARKGTPKDYEKLHAHVARSLLKVPDWVDMDTVKKLGKAGQLGLNTMIKEHKPERPSDEQAQYHGGKVGEAVHKLTDALSWLVQEAGGGKNNPVPWLGNLPQYALKPFRGEAQTEVDEQYARLLSGGYKKLGERPEQSLGWQRVPKWDTEYVSVWDNPDGHRFICVRGTNPTAKKDLLHDVNIARLGTTYDEVGPELQRILDDTEPSRIVDIAGHSLGTVLILQAYKNNKDLQSRIHMTRLYNPAYNPQLLAAGWMPSVAKDYEQDPRVRYLINLGDVVGLGGMGGAGPKNVVYRTPLGNTIQWNETGGGLDPYHLHTLRQWQGPYWDGLDDPKPLPTPESTGLPQERVDEMQGIYRPEVLEYTGPSGLADLVEQQPNELDTGAMAQGDVLDFGDDEDFLNDLRQRLGNF